MKIGKFNILSLSKKDKDSSPLSLGSGDFGKKRLSASPNMLPHEESLFFKVKYGDDYFIRRLSDTTILLQAEKYGQIYGQNYYNRLEKGRQASPAQQLRDNMTDEELHNSVVSRHYQHPSELQAVSEIAMQEMDKDSSAAYQEAVKQQKQDQQQPAKTDEGATVSSE